ncbi:heavy-metal-associated domain-containing protein [Peptacetobacter sp.]|uniref:heavy-metal-associated domain-containing protein n=1 Tax=Peptacetobacter sp. TaxID=2991975 RepID=UPI002618988C|nr:heavy metal-associated domain-containing protein [Peptacetobacter sp.]
MKRIVKIEGMGCQHCINRITEALSALDGVEVLEVSLENKSATVNANDSVTDEALMNAVNEEGFEAIEVIK